MYDDMVSVSNQSNSLRRPFVTPLDFLDLRREDHVGSESSTPDSAFKGTSDITSPRGNQIDDDVFLEDVRRQINEQQTHKNDKQAGDGSTENLFYSILQVPIGVLVVGLFLRHFIDGDSP